MMPPVFSLARRYGRAATMALFSVFSNGCVTVPGHEASGSFPLPSPDSAPTVPARHLAESSEWLQRRYAQIASDLNGDVDLAKVRVLLVGDSITQMWRGEEEAKQAAVWRATFADPDSKNYALNLGVAGDRTENVLLRLLSRSEGGFGELDDARIQPEVIVLMIGTNNLGSRRPDAVAEIVQGQVAIIERLHALRPQARLIVNSVLPLDDEALNANVVRPINRLLQAEVAQRAYASWLDLHASYLSADGTLNAGLFRDGVHPNARGYAIWKAALLPKLEALRQSQQ